jgi:hypothetical protein
LTANDTTFEEHFLKSSIHAESVSHKFAVGDEVTVEGKVGERANRTMAFPAFVEDLLPGGGYHVRRVLSCKSRRYWVKIEDGSRVQARAVLLSTRESIEDRSGKNHQLAAAEARAEVEKCRANEREKQLERETEKRKEAERKGKSLAKAAEVEKSIRVAAENRCVADVARAQSTFASLRDEAVAAQTAHLQAEVEAVRRESSESIALLRRESSESIALHARRWQEADERACNEEVKRKRAEGEAAAVSKRADEAGRAAAAAEKENAAAMRALRRVVASANAVSQQQLDALKAQHDVMMAKVLRSAQTAVDETKESAAAEHATDLLQHEQVRLLEREGGEGGDEVEGLLTVVSSHFLFQTGPSVRTRGEAQGT